MRNKLFILTFFCFSCVSCNNHKIDASTQDSMWFDLRSFVGDSKEYKIFFPDSSWLYKPIKGELDTSFINKNIRTLDINLAKYLDEFRQLFVYKFNVLDTLQNDQSRHKLLILEQYKDTVMLDKSISLKLIVTSGEYVVSSFTLAEDYTTRSYNSTISSIILPGNKVITRTIKTTYSDMADFNGSLPSKSYQLTKFFKYDNQLGQYVSWKKSIRKDQ